MFMLSRHVDWFFGLQYLLSLRHYWLVFLWSIFSFRKAPWTFLPLYLCWGTSSHMECLFLQFHKSKYHLPSKTQANLTFSLLPVKVPLILTSGYEWFLCIPEELFLQHDYSNQSLLCTIPDTPTFLKFQFLY
jgi:hypothetical protein